MDKTIKINLGGTLFHIDEEAYNILRRYLNDIDKRLKNTPGGAETIEDIESRIAEIFQSQGGTAGVISRDNIEAMISIIGKPEDFDIPGETHVENENTFRSSGRKKMYRNPDDSIISGVCGGIGAYLDIESVWIRLFFILFACFFGIGFFVYIGLWIALPSALSDEQKIEMYGNNDYPSDFKRNKKSYSNSGSQREYSTAQPRSSSVGNAFNEVFRALGRVCYIVLRIFLIFVGLTFVISGFIFLVSVIMVFFFKYPDYFSTHSFGVNLFYLPDFMNYVVNPAIAPWIMVLLFLVILFPLLAIIYWGIKMIFWFKARDGIIGLTGLIIWVICVAALSILLFNEGISYSETAKTVSEKVIEKPPANLYVYADHKVADLHYDKDISIPDEDYAIYFIDDNKGLFINSRLIIENSNENSLRINVRKLSAGRSRTDALQKAENLVYNYRISGDTLFLDEYFSIPPGNKWSFDNVTVTLFIPEGTRVRFDKTSEKMFRDHHYDSEEWIWNSNSNEEEFIQSRNNSDPWIMTDEGLRRNRENPEKTK